MRKTRFIALLAMLLMLGGNAVADNVVTTNNVTLKPGGTGELIVSLESDATFSVYAYDFRLYLPEGIEVDKKPSGAYVYELKERNADHSSNVMETSDGAIQFGVSSPTLALTGNTGEVLGITLKAATTLSEGVYEASIKTITYANKEAETVHPADITFNIVVANNVVELDENSPSVPEATNEAVDIKVMRTLKAGEWSTICLPFDMTEEQTKAAFGDDVVLKEFTDYVVEYDADDKVTGITVNFEDVDLTEGFYGNYPYLIKVSSDIDEFTVNATVDPVEDDCYTEYDNDRTGKNRKVFGTFRGTYHAETTVPNKCLFLSGNKFWYSTGLTKMKAFRAYFDFVDVLAEIDNANARISMSFDDETTGIKYNVNDNENDNYYDLQGRRVEHPKKGLYIKNNKKVVVK